MLNRQACVGEQGHEAVPIWGRRRGLPQHSDRRRAAPLAARSTPGISCRG